MDICLNRRIHTILLYGKTWHNVYVLIDYVDNITVSFDQKRYDFDEINGSANAVLVLSNQSSSNISVRVCHNATGELAICLIECKHVNYIYE